MDLELYSVFLSVACIALLGGVAITSIGYFVSTTERTRLLSINYFEYIKMIGTLSIIATVGTLIYQFYYLTPVCEYCWWQRIFMYPIDFIVIGSILMKTKGNELIIAALASIGAIFAAFHYWFHYNAIFLAQDIAPCSSIGIIPSCSETPVVIFGFITIPLMALVVFISILWLCFLAHKVRTS